VRSGLRVEMGRVLISGAWSGWIMDGWRRF